MKETNQVLNQTKLSPQGQRKIDWSLVRTESPCCDVVLCQGCIPPTNIKVVIMFKINQSDIHRVISRSFSFLAFHLTLRKKSHTATIKPNRNESRVPRSNFILSNSQGRNCWEIPDTVAFPHVLGQFSTSDSSRPRPSGSGGGTMLFT